MKIAYITTNEERYLEAILNSDLGVEISVVITNNPCYPMIGFCEKKGILCEVIDHKDFTDRKEHDRAIKEKLDNFKLDLVILAGYKRLIKNKDFLNSYGEKMINIHNSFLPNFPGPRPHEEVFKAGIKKSGYTIHFVDAIMDRGDIIVQEKVDISNCESPQEVYDKITKAGCLGMIKVLNNFIDSKSLKPLNSNFT